MPTPPPQTPESRARALEKAAVSRRVRAEAKEKLKMGSLNLAELFVEADAATEPGEMLSKLKVVNVLESLPGVGKVRARKIMEELEISDSRRIRGLGANQRKALLERFPD
jgi:DNA uptake protein ComE-like DNA-binding protein